MINFFFGAFKRNIKHSFCATSIFFLFQFCYYERRLMKNLFFGAALLVIFLITIFLVAGFLVAGFLVAGFFVAGFFVAGFLVVGFSVGRKGSGIAGPLLGWG